MLSDVVKRDKSAKTIEECLQKEMEAGINDLNLEVFYSSDVTKCDRRIIYKAIGTSHDINMNEKIHEEYIVKKWVSIFNNIKGVEVVDTGTIVADHNYNLTETIHCVINVDGAVAVIMIKEVSDELFKKGASRNHIVDLMSQLWMAEVNDGFLIYDNKDSRDFTVYHVIPNVSILNTVREKCSDLISYKISGILPERKYKDSKGDECSSCEFRKMCW
jgi:CRISPR/Cas system-associated exonuclease Cas4 (RecB family)